MKERLLAIALLLGTTAITAQTIFSPVMGDMALYREIGERVLRGVPLYGESPFEYPPYVLVWWLLPALRSLSEGRESAFIKPFGVELLLIDVAIKWLLLVEGRKRLRGVRAYVPFVIYAATSIVLQYIFLRRFDLIPAGMTLFSAVLLAAGWPLASGALLAAGVGTKLYPIVLAPLFFVAAWQRGNRARWLAGFALGLAPLGVLAFFMPWWRFTQAHQIRGLQVESLYAGFIWLNHRLGGSAIWVQTPGGSNVGGTLAHAVLPWGKALWGAATFSSVLLVAWRASTDRLDLGRLSRLALIPLTAFIGFNFVLSPQYMIWIAGFVALAATAGFDWRLAMLFLAILLGPAIYPTPTYAWGYDLPHVLALCLRNCLLVVAWLGLTAQELRPSAMSASIATVSTASLPRQS